MNVSNEETINPTENDTQNLAIDVELDWEAYFAAFCEAHGKYPVVYGKEQQLLLFPDGWMYSAVSYEGPEYKAPDDKKQLYSLQLTYWQRRYRIIKRELDQIINRLQVLEDIARSRSLPLYQVNEYTNEEGKVISESKRLDLTIMRKRREWLEKDMKNCKTMIHAIGQKLQQLGEK